jgi:2-C-methyl-D-erythritol 4-phosphate cytidylyltransferase
VSLHLLIPAAGDGTRLGSDLPKALVSIGGRPLLSVTLAVFDGIPFLRGVVIAPPSRVEDVERAANRRFPVIAGGASRAESVALGVGFLDPGPRDFVVIHDAARPFVSREEVEQVIAAAEETGAAIAVMPCRHAQALGRRAHPQDRRSRRNHRRGYPAGISRRRPAAALEAPPSTDEAARCEALGIPVAAVPVSRLAFKITFPEDLAIAEALVRNHAPARPLPLEREGRKL